MVATAKFIETKLLVTATLAAAILIAAVECVQAFQVGVSPMRHEFQLDTKPVTRSIKLFNQGPKDMKVKLRVANFDLDANNKVREIAPTAQSLDQWIIIRPLAFTIKSGQTRTVRFAVRPTLRPRAGEYRAVIFIDRADRPKKNKSKLNIGFRFGVVVYAHVGNVVRVGKLHGIQTESNGLGFDVQSTGSAHVRMNGTYGVWPASKFPGKTIAAAMISRGEFAKQKNYVPKGAATANLLPSLPVLPRTRRTLRANFAKSLPSGSYRALVKGMLGNNSMSRELSFKVGG